MKEYINGHELYWCQGGHANTLIYIDNKLASNGIDKRPLKNRKFWRDFLKKEKDFNAMCLLPTIAPWNTKRTFEDIYENITSKSS